LGQFDSPADHIDQVVTRLLEGKDADRRLQDAEVCSVQPDAHVPAPAERKGMVSFPVVPTMAT
jgi:hypothetical protein